MHQSLVCLDVRVMHMSSFTRINSLGTYFMILLCMMPYIFQSCVGFFHGKPKRRLQGPCDLCWNFCVQNMKSWKTQALHFPYFSGLFERWDIQIFRSFTVYGYKAFHDGSTNCRGYLEGNTFEIDQGQYKKCCFQIVRVIWLSWCFRTSIFFVK